MLASSTITDLIPLINSLPPGIRNPLIVLIVVCALYRWIKSPDKKEGDA